MMQLVRWEYAGYLLLVPQSLVTGRLQNHYGARDVYERNGGNGAQLRAEWL